MFTTAGVKNEGVLFLIGEDQIKDKNERLFMYINDFLSSGYIPNLFSKDEKESMINKLAAKAKKDGYINGVKSVWDYFLYRVRQNLHFCLCFSPMGNCLRARSMRFPSIINCTVSLIVIRFIFVLIVLMFVCLFVYVCICLFV